MRMNPFLVLHELIISYVQQFDQFLQSLQIKTGRQYYELSEDVFGIGVNGTNVYGVLRAPRGDATEAIVLSTSWKTLDGHTDVGGVSLLMSLARYFERNACLILECC